MQCNHIPNLVTDKCTPGALDKLGLLAPLNTSERQLADAFSYQKHHTKSSYAELIFWTACKIAAFNKVPFHLIDRSSEGLTSESSQYYAALGGEFNYQEMKVDQAITTTISSGGKLLKVKGGVVREREIQTILISILYLYL